MKVPSPSQVGPLLTDDIACHGCGYNLRGLRTDGACPECNAPVWVSTAGEELRYAEPLWLATVSRGAQTILYGFLGMWLPPATVGTIFSPFGAEKSSFAAAAIVTLEGAALLWLLWGLWCFSTPEPGCDEVGLSPRKWIRVGVVSCGLTCALLGPTRYVPMANVALVSVLLLGSPVGLTGLLATLGYARYVEKLAERSSDTASQEAADTYRGFYLLGWGSGAIAGLAAMAIPPAAFLLLVCVPVMLIFGSLILIMPHRILKPIRDAFAESQRHWGAVPPLHDDGPQ